jgi:hypothetical protein
MIIEKNKVLEVDLSKLLNDLPHDQNEFTQMGGNPYSCVKY